MPHGRFIGLWAGVMVLVGCASPMPHPVSFPASSQPHMQAAAHWDQLARETAAKIGRRIVDSDYFHGEIPAIVPDPWNCPLPCKSEIYPEFHRTYRMLLASHLDKLGFATTDRQDAPLVIRYETQWIRHRSQRNLAWPTTTLVSGAAVAGGGLEYAYERFGLGSVRFWGWPLFVSPFIDLANGHDPGVISDSEVVVTTSLSHLGRVVFSESRIFYVNTRDRDHFVPPVYYSIGAVKE